MQINATFDANGYVENYATVGTIDTGIDVTIEGEITEEDLYDKYNCYKKVEDSDVLQFDEEKYTSKHAADISHQANRMYVPDTRTSMLNFMRIMAPTMELTAENKLSISGIYEDWAPGKFVTGDIRNWGGNTWECFQDHDNAVYPDIRPDNSAWYTFWRPLHGTSIETARPFVPVQGAHDLYKAGEYVVFTDDKIYRAKRGNIYRAKRDTNFSPTDYAPDWELIEV